MKLYSTCNKYSAVKGVKKNPSNCQLKFSYTGLAVVAV